MFKYINMPTLVAHYLKEFSVRSDTTTSQLYKFIFCLCLPFVSDTFNRARMDALAIAECTTSRDQISRVLNKVTGADVTFIPFRDEFFVGYDGTSDATVEQLLYTVPENVIPTDSPIAPFSAVPNSGNMLVDLNGYSQAQFESYLSLLIPFYINFKITYV